MTAKPVSLTREQVLSALGPVEDVVIAQIIGTGASPEELAEARAWVANDEPLVNTGKRLASGRVAQLVEILAAMEEREPGPRGEPEAH
jgi:hypothetical protein